MDEMMNRITFFVTIVFAISLFPVELFARAGGGGGGGGGIGAAISLPFVLIYLAILHYKLGKKNREALDLLKKVSRIDPMWEKSHLKKRVEKTFFRVQEAWMERDQDKIRDCVSERLYRKHKLQTDIMMKNHEKNILSSIDLIEFFIVELLDFKDDNKDSFWVYIKGSMIDYTINEKTNNVIKGKKDEVETFTELWKFARSGSEWVLDEIDQKVQLKDLDRFSSMSEISKTA